MTAKVDFTKISLQDALDLAILIEEEARERYIEFTKVVGGGYEGDAADVFESMSRNEAKHGQQLQERRKKLFGATPSRVNRSMVFDIEAPDSGAPRPFMGPRQAAEVAMEGEKKAWAFFTEALQHVKDAEVKSLFVELQGEELEHQAVLQRLMEHLPEGADVAEEDADEPSAL
ncbi:ferritin family protein [Bdellovibrionota bacterium FG-2]